MVLETCVTALQESGESVDACLARYPDEREELEPLLHLAVLLQSARTVKAPRDFRHTSASRIQNLVAARPRSVAQEAGEPFSVRRVREWFTAFFGLRIPFPATAVISILLALVVVGVGTVYASAETAPGHLLYPVKTTVEDARLSLSLSDRRRAELRLAFGARRLDEAIALLETNRPQGVDDALADYEGQLASVLALLADDSGLPPEERLAVAERLAASLIHHHEARLEVLLDRAGPGERAAVERAWQAYREALRRARDVVGGGPDYGLPALSPTPTRTPTPTSSPTVSPSPARSTSSPEPPVSSPSPIPSDQPASAATGLPTSVPTESPTEVPTARSTDAPTAWPTDAPTSWPPGAPTAWPTDAPTAWPTDAPTGWPPGAPTAWPTPRPRPTRWGG